MITFTAKELDELLKKIRADEREACANICVANGALGLAAAIRARGQA